LPAPDAPSVQPNPPASASTHALQALKNWSHPFKDKNPPLLQLTQLAKAASGYYPLGRNGLWHGGVHFDSGTAGTLEQSSVHCLADGEVVAYRIDEHSPTTTYFVNELCVPKPFSRNFVLVRHRLEAPKIEGNTDIPPSLTFYSLYMHLQDWAVYQNDPVIARPAFWPEGQTHRVKATVKNVLPGHPGQQGLNVLNQAQRGKVLALLPRGAEVTVSGEGEFRKLENTNGPDVLKSADGSLRGYLFFDKLEPIAGGEFRINATALNVREEANARSAIITPLPNGTEVTISGEGEFRKLERVSQYVHFNSLEGAREPMADRIVVLDQPIAIKAGELIGHIGKYQDSGAEHPEKKLHLEVFSGDEVEAFIKDSENWALRMPATDKTWLKLAKGTKVVTHQDRFNAAQPPTLSEASILSNADLLVPKSLLDGLSAERKIAIPATAERKAYNWYRLEGLLHDATNTLRDGWVREEVGATPRVNPWSWEGYSTIFNYDSPRHSLASHLRSVGRFNDAELGRYGALADTSDKGPMKSRLYDIIDRDDNGTITAEELRDAIRLPAHAQSLSQLIIHYESEWHYTQKWDALDEVLGHSGSTPHLNWLAEKERIKQMSWWSEVAPKVGLPANGQVYHLHPVGLVGTFSTANPLEITHAQLKLIFPAANDVDIDVVLGEIHGRLTEFKLDTRLRQRHFFAQIKGEVGPSMKGVSESWEYSPEVLKSFSAYYRAHPAEAEEDGYLKDSRGRIVRRANQREIGRKHFQRLNGNRTSSPDDGYNFRGRGLIQVTGYEKYHGYMSDYNKYWSGDAPDTVRFPELINESPNAIRSAIWFWLYKKPYTEDQGRGFSDVTGVTRIVNGGAVGLSERKQAYTLIEGVLK
jgi:predicted chitinase